MDKIINKFNKINLNSMKISNERLAEFIELIEIKTGEQLSEQVALTEAEKLLRLISIIYQPATIDDYCSALVKKISLKTKSV